MAPNKWEYLVFRLSEYAEHVEIDQRSLNELGNKGWELVTVIPATGWAGRGQATFSTAYLKRLSSPDNI